MAEKLPRFLPHSSSTMNLADYHGRMSRRSGVRSHTVPWRLLWSLVLMSAVAGGQTPDGGAQVSGSVRNSLSGQPLAKAVVRLVPSSGRVGYVRTAGPSGEFAFDGVAAGDYLFRVERRGFLDHPTGGGLLHLTPGQKVAGLELGAVPFAVVTGVVTEGEGEPVPGAEVRALAVRWSDTGRWYEEAQSAEADDRGEFRLTGLEPGRYIFYAAAPGQDSLGTPVKDPSGKGERRLGGVYYPNAYSIEGASPVAIQAGQELNGIALRMAWLPCFHIRGQAALLAGQVLATRRFNDRSLRWQVEDSERHIDGSFDIAGLTPGEYLVMGMGEHGPQGSAVPVTIESRDVTGVVISGVEPEFRAQVRMEGDGTAPLPAGVYLRLEPLEGNFNARYVTVPVSATGAARLPSVIPARYALVAGANEGGIYVRSVRAGQQEVRTQALDLRGGPVDVEIVLATGTGRVQGVAQWLDPGPPPVPGEMLRAVLVPLEPRPGNRAVWFAGLDQTGAFAFSEIPPGKYYGFITSSTDNGLWTNRDFLAQVQSAGISVEVSEKGGGKLQVPVLPAAVVERAMETLR